MVGFKKKQSSKSRWHELHLLMIFLPKVCVLSEIYSQKFGIIIMEWLLQLVPAYRCIIVSLTCYQTLCTLHRPCTLTALPLHTRPEFTGRVSLHWTTLNRREPCRGWLRLKIVYCLSCESPQVAFFPHLFNNIHWARRWCRFRESLRT